MKTYKNDRFVKRDYECSNVVAVRCSEDRPPSQHAWTECDESIIENLQKLWIEHENGNKIERFGWL